MNLADFYRLVRIGTTKAIPCAWMAATKEVSAVVVKAFKSFQIFPVPDGESGQSCGELELEWDQYGEWPDFSVQLAVAVEPAGLNGWIRHRLSGEGSGGELERCLRWRPKSM